MFSDFQDFQSDDELGSQGDTHAASYDPVFWNLTCGMVDPDW